MFALRKAFSFSEFMLLLKDPGYFRWRTKVYRPVCYEIDAKSM